MFNKVVQYATSDRTHELYSKYENILLSPPTELKGDALFARLFGRLEQLGAMTLSIAAADFIGGDNEKAVQNLNKGFVYLLSAYKANQALWRQIGNKRVLDRTVEVLISCQSAGHLLGYNRQSEWLAGAVLQSWEMGEGWVDPDDYLPSFLVCIAASIESKSLTVIDPNTLNPLVVSLFQADDSSHAQKALLDCADYRYRRSVDSQIKVLDDEFLYYSLAAIPFELLAFQKLASQCNGCELELSHECNLPNFNMINDASSNYEDAFVSQISEMTREYSS